MPNITHPLFTAAAPLLSVWFILEVLHLVRRWGSNNHQPSFSFIGALSILAFAASMVASGLNPALPLARSLQGLHLAEATGLDLFLIQLGAVASCRIVVVLLTSLGHVTLVGAQQAHSWWTNRGAKEPILR